ncbi:MAG: MFS transporter, partial [Chloroflexi bacterium]|nr:MFS transporter [Chloroflexota bacterium]
MSSILLLVLLPFSSYIASLPIIRDEWQMSNAQAAVVFSAYLIGYAVSSLVLVPLTDRIS